MVGKPRPYRYHRRLGTYRHTDQSSYRSNNIIASIEKPGGTYKGSINSNECLNNGIPFHYEENKSSNTTDNPNNSCNNPQNRITKLVRTSQLQKDGYFTNHKSYLQRRNLNINEKQANYIKNINGVSEYYADPREISKCNINIHKSSNNHLNLIKIID